jgi:hypothetical protein
MSEMTPFDLLVVQWDQAAMIADILGAAGKLSAQQEAFRKARLSMGETPNMLELHRISRVAVMVAILCQLDPRKVEAVRAMAEDWCNHESDLWEYLRARGGGQDAPDCPCGLSE